MNGYATKQGFTLIELVIVVVILGILAAILVPIISGMLEIANQATDNANARLIYNASAMWFSENNSADDDLSAIEINKYLGLSVYPTAKSQAFIGEFSVSVTSSGNINVSTSYPANYNPETGKLEPQ